MRMRVGVEIVGRWGMGAEVGVMRVWARVVEVWVRVDWGVRAGVELRSGVRDGRSGVDERRRVAR